MSGSGDFDLWVFRDFIEGSLNMDGFSAYYTPPSNLAMFGKLQLPKTYGELSHDVRVHFRYFLKQKPGQDYWLELLTPFEAQTRALLVELLTAGTSLRFTVPIPDDLLREVLTYSTTIHWLVFTALLDQYASAESDGPSNISDVPF